MNEFMFDTITTPWDLAKARLKRGDVLSAGRFLTLVRTSDGVSPEDAALKLEQMGVLLDTAGLPVGSGNPETAARLKLECELLEKGGWKENLDRNDPLLLFMQELPSAPFVGDGVELAKRGRNGDEKATQRLVQGYLPFVYEMAADFAGRGVLLMDLIQEASLGLWQAVINYEDGSFDGYARWWILSALNRAVTLQAESDGVGGYLAGQIEKYQKADKTLLTRLGRNPTDQELAEELGITLEETLSLGKMLREIQNMARLKQETQPEKDPQEEELAVEDTAYYQTRETVSDLMSALTERETMVLNLRYGLNGKAPMTALETAEKLNMTASEVTAVENAALAKMRGQ